MAKIQTTREFYQQLIMFDAGAAGGNNLFHPAYFSRQDPSDGNCGLHALNNALQRNAFDD